MAAIILIEFADNGKPFSVVTDDGLRYDVDFCETDGLLYYHCCAAGSIEEVPYLEGSDHKYWAAPGVEVVLGDNTPAPPGNRLVRLPGEYSAPIEEWEGAMEGCWPCFGSDDDAGDP